MPLQKSEHSFICHLCRKPKDGDLYYSFLIKKYVFVCDECYQTALPTFISKSNPNGITREKMTQRLTAGMQRVDVSGIIKKIESPRSVTLKNGEKARVANLVLSTKSYGDIRLVLWNDQIDQVAEGVGATIQDGYTTSFRGEVQLNVGRYGKFTVDA